MSGYGSLTAADAGQNAYQGYLGAVPKPQPQMQRPMGMGGMAQPMAAGGGYLDGAAEIDPMAAFAEKLKREMEAKLGPYHPIPEFFGGAGPERQDHGIQFSDYSPYVSAPKQGY